MDKIIWRAASGFALHILLYLQYTELLRRANSTALGDRADETGLLHPIEGSASFTSLVG